MRNKPYHQLLGMLIWAQAVMQPDLSYAVAFLARFQSNPGLVHWKALLYILAYVKEMLGYRLRYTKDLGGSVKPLGYIGCQLWRRSRHMQINIQICLHDGWKASLIELKMSANYGSIYN